MCGIAGQMNFDRGHPADEIMVRRMNDLLSHRGPDEEGYFFDHNIGLGHKRLAIIDLHTGRQPVYANDNQSVIVFNGEIYNFPAIREELEGIGHHFYTKTDTETVLHAWLAWGAGCFHRFNGEWAMAIWSVADRELILSRDRYGIKPLYYHTTGTGLLFASEVKSLGAAMALEPDLPEVWDRLVFGPLSGGKTSWTGIHELAPGSWMSVKEDQITHHRWYDLAESFHRRSVYDADKLEWLITDSIERRLMADVPIGTLNSGGLDSSLIAAIAQEKWAGKLNTFCVAPEEVAGQQLPGDESTYANILAHHIGSYHSTVRYSQELFLDDLPRAVAMNDDILYHPSTVALSYLFRDIKQNHGVKVVLGGEGADEVFRGYSYNKLAMLYRRYGGVMKGAIVARFARLQAVKPLTSHLPFPLQMAIARNAHLTPNQATRLTGFQGDISDDRMRLIHETEHLKGLDKLIFYEQKCYLAGLLHRIDRMSLRWGVEARMPFLDHRIVEYINAVKPEVKNSISNNSLKKILKTVAGKKLPNQIISRKKYGFAAPLTDYAEKIDAMINRYQTMSDPDTTVHQKYIILNYLILYHTTPDA